MVLLALLPAFPASAQLPAPNEAGVTTGHVHYMVPDMAVHLAIWESLGGEAEISGSVGAVMFPGIFVRITEVEEAPLPSIRTTANHVGFSVKDYSRYRSILSELGAEIFYENEDDGQVLADLPDGVRVEILTDPEQQEPIVFHHMHVVGEDLEALQDWYGQVFGAEPGERRGLPSALVPGGRVDIMGVMGEAPLPSQEGALHHIGFEVVDIEVFAAHVESLGIELDMEPTPIPDTDITTAFVTDPAGTYIEVTEGLAGSR